MRRTAAVCALLACAPMARADTLGEEDRFELTAGFLGGARSYGWAPFAVSAPRSAPAGIDAPFEAAPFQDTLVFGPAWESRIVVQGIRGTVGVQLPFPDWEDRADHTATLSDGTAASAEARGMLAPEIRLGLGFEPRIGPVTPFVDLVGDIHLVQAELAIDDKPSTWHSRSFSLAPRAGVRVELGDAVFTEVSADYGVFGAHEWGAQWMVGVALH